MAFLHPRGVGLDLAARTSANALLRSCPRHSDQHLIPRPRRRAPSLCSYKIPTAAFLVLTPSPHTPTPSWEAASRLHSLPAGNDWDQQKRRSERKSRPRSEEERKQPIQSKIEQIVWQQQKQGRRRKRRGEREQLSWVLKGEASLNDVAKDLSIKGRFRGASTKSVFVSLLRLRCR